MRSWGSAAARADGGRSGTASTHDPSPGRVHGSTAARPRPRPQMHQDPSPHARDPAAGRGQATITLDVTGLQPYGWGGVHWNTSLQHSYLSSNAPNNAPNNRKSLYACVHRQGSERVVRQGFVDRGCRPGLQSGVVKRGVDTRPSRAVAYRTGGGLGGAGVQSSWQRCRVVPPPAVATVHDPPWEQRRHTGGSTATTPAQSVRPSALACIAAGSSTTIASRPRT